MKRTTDAPKRQVAVWDLPTRLFHWLLAASVIIGWLLAEFGPNRMTLHFWLGYAVIGLLVFRLVWGFVGPAPARFTQFIRGPRAVLGYAREMVRSADPDDYINVGPLASEVSSATSRMALRWHHRGADLILILVLLHWAAIVFYRLWKREDLVWPMITGWKWVRRR